ncbi:MAG: hypothetical protein CM15mP74_32670 [Halieaceae bacterium]|nr:MAG: hypothetical protein CM15mP74_32670 [Halieaceae bacterium]
MAFGGFPPRVALPGLLGGFPHAHGARTGGEKEPRPTAQNREFPRPFPPFLKGRKGSTCHFFWAKPEIPLSAMRCFLDSHQFRPLSRLTMGDIGLDRALFINFWPPVRWGFSPCRESDRQGPTVPEKNAELGAFTQHRHPGLPGGPPISRIEGGPKGALMDDPGQFWAPP